MIIFRWLCIILLHVETNTNTKYRYLYFEILRSEFYYSCGACSFIFITCTGVITTLEFGYGNLVMRLYSIMYWCHAQGH